MCGVPLKLQTKFLKHEITSLIFAGMIYVLCELAHEFAGELIMYNAAPEEQSTVALVSATESNNELSLTDDETEAEEEGQQRNGAADRHPVRLRRFHMHQLRIRDGLVTEEVEVLLRPPRARRQHQQGQQQPPESPKVHGQAPFSRT